MNITLYSTERQYGGPIRPQSFEINRYSGYSIHLDIHVKQPNQYKKLNIIMEPTEAKQLRQMLLSAAEGEGVTAKFMVEFPTG